MTRRPARRSAPAAAPRRWAAAARTGAVHHALLLLALVAALFAATALPADAAPKPAPQPLPSQQVDWGSTDLDRLVAEYRRLHRDDVWGPTAATNVAVFEYEHDGATFTVTVGSVSNFNKRDAQGNVVPPTAIIDIRDASGRLVRSLRIQHFTTPEARRHTRNHSGSVTSKHSEFLAFLALVEHGVDPAAVTRIHSELAPCDLPGKHCVRKVAERHPAATVTYNFEYGAGHTPAQREASRRRGVEALERTVGAYHRGLDAGYAASRRLFSPTGGGSADGPLISLLTGRGPPPGGIDFRTLQLRHVGDARGGDGDGLTYSLAAGPSSEVFDADRTIDAARQASDAFFVWLSLRPSTFWVNLSPDEPDRIIDEQLGRTAVGRVLLEADLELKKTVGHWIHPDQALGRRYWDRVRAEPDGEFCLSFRMWIVPEPAVVRDEGASMTILDAPLDVKLESEHVDVPGVTQESCRDRDAATEAHNEAVFRELILPRVRRAVNRAPRYADLRRVYTSRVAAEWYRDRSRTTGTAYAGLVDSGDISPWALSGRWRPRDVFDAFVDSYTNGEFDVTRRTTAGNLVYEAVYMFGGVDFSAVELREVGADVMEREQAGLSDAIQRSITRAATDAGEQLWLGAVTRPDPADAAALRRRPLGSRAPGLATQFLLTIALLIAFGVILWRRGVRW